MKYQMIVEFSFPYPIRGNTDEIKVFVKNALEAWGGQRHPDDWLFDSLEHVKVVSITEKER